MLMDKTFLYIYENKEYIVEITYKRMKNIRYRFKDDKFLVSASRLASLNQIKLGIEKFAPKLIKKAKKEKLIGEDYIYIFGKKVILDNKKEIIFSNGEIIKYKDINDLIISLNKLLLKVIESRQIYYENLMNINPHYKCRIKKVSSIYGSNSKKTHSISYSNILLHYDFKIIDTIIVHELAHHFVRNHSKSFYDVVLKYYPNYYKYNKMLKKGEVL
jgi:predicted metal-dependent hydrolase